MATAALVGLSVFQAGATLYGSNKQSKAMREQANQEAALAEFNAKVADAQAEDALRRGEEYAGQFRKEVSGLIGKQRVGIAGQGIDVSTGTAADIQRETKLMGEEDASKIISNSWREAMGLRIQAQNYRMGGKNAYNAGMNQAGNTMLSGGLQAVNALGSGIYNAYRT